MPYHILTKIKADENYRGPSSSIERVRQEWRFDFRFREQDWDSIDKDPWKQKDDLHGKERLEWSFACE